MKFQGLTGPKNRVAGTLRGGGMSRPLSHVYSQHRAKCSPESWQCACLREKRMKEVHKTVLVCFQTYALLEIGQRLLLWVAAALGVSRDRFGYMCSSCPWRCFDGRRLPGRYCRGSWGFYSQMIIILGLFRTLFTSFSEVQRKNC